MHRFLEANRTKLTPYTIARLEKRIAIFLQEDEEQAFQSSFERLVSHQKVDLTSGFKEYNLEKLKNMILYLVKHLNGVLKVKLNKLLWYCDFLYFKENSVSITGAQYVRITLGQVPDHYELIFANMIHEGILSESEILYQTKDGEKIGEEYTALIEPDESLFSEKEIQVINFVADTFRDDTSTSIKEKAHREAAYKQCKDGDIISYEYAKKLSLSLST